MDRTILANLIFNEKYARAVIPFIKQEYFTDASDQIVFKQIKKFIDQYNAFPNKEALYIELSNNKELKEQQFEAARSVIVSLEKSEDTNQEWLKSQTEIFCRDRAVYNAIHKAIKIYDNKLREYIGRIPEILQDAIAVSFDANIGHNFIEDAASRYDYYHREESRVGFGLYYLNEITRGGLPPATLNVVVAPTGAGKTALMCNLAAHNLIDNRNVLYITMEMAETEIAKRIDQNLLDVNLDQLLHLSKLEYEKKLEKIKLTTHGKLVIKEYPTSTAHSGHFRHLLNELKIKKKFIPDIIYIDYINICASSRMKLTGDTYVYIKAIAEELRGLAVEFKLPIFTATQSNRDSFGASDFDMKNTSESIGLPQTADFMIAMIVTEELNELGQVMFKQLKNRYNDPFKNQRFVVGFDRSKMKLYDVENSAQENIMDGPIMDQSKFMSEEKERQYGNKFKGFRLE